MERVIIGRNAEKRILEQALHSPEAELIAVYGRRRVGKTFLIQKTFAEQMIFECIGLNDRNAEDQLQNFWHNLVRVAGLDPLIEPPSSWLQAFGLLRTFVESLRGRKKKVIFLDEIPWLDTPRSGFLAALGNFWNAFASQRTDLIVVVCGSAASWMIRKIVRNRGGLHNRITKRLRLLPFTLGETKAYLYSRKINLKDYDLLQLYMATGGIPYYLKQALPGQSVAQIIDALFFDQNAFLRHEFEDLYASLFNNHQLHIAIIKALASKHRGMTRSEILGQVPVASGGAFSGYLNELEESGFILSLLPFTNKKKETLYRLIDEFSLFYLKFLYRARKPTAWISKAGQQTYKIWCGHAFENICFRHLSQIKQALGISGVYTEVSSWVIKPVKDAPGAQIDLIIDRADHCISVCEIKFYHEVFEIDNKYAAALREKLNTFQRATKTSKNIFLTMITTFGVQRNANMLSLVNSTVEMDALFGS